jgi:hypothetical protein
MYKLIGQGPVYGYTMGEDMLQMWIWLHFHQTIFACSLFGGW